MSEKDKMEFKVVHGNVDSVDRKVNRLLETGWEIISETDSRATHRKFSGGKAIGGAVLLGPVGLLAGGIGKNKKTGEVRVRLQRPVSIRLKEEAEQAKKIAKMKAEKEKKKAEKQAIKAKKQESRKNMSNLEKLDDMAQNNSLADSPLTTFYWYKKLRKHKKTPK